MKATIFFLVFLTDIVPNTKENLPKISTGKPQFKGFYFFIPDLHKTEIF